MIVVLGLRPECSALRAGAQLVGFFIVEDRVQRGAEDLTLGLQLDAGWESGAATLKALLEGAFESAAAAPQLLEVKDFVLLVCSALGADRDFSRPPAGAACGAAGLEPERAQSGGSTSSQ